MAVADFIEMNLRYLVEGIKFNQDEDGKLYIEILADTLFMKQPPNH
jgi:hypothetical protein